MLAKYIKVLKQRKKTPYQDKNWHKQLSFFLSFFCEDKDSISADVLHEFLFLGDGKST